MLLAPKQTAPGCALAMAITSASDNPLNILAGVKKLPKAERGLVASANAARQLKIKR
jgi:hypothetical protein